MEECKPLTCGTIATYPFFLSFVIIVSIIMLNLLTAVIIENFENQQDHGKAEAATSIPYEYICPSYVPSLTIKTVQ